MITVAYLCLKNIDFDAVDFSERCSKEVISFFWRSVYIYFFQIQGLVVPSKRLKMALTIIITSQFVSYKYNHIIQIYPKKNHDCYNK